MQLIYKLSIIQNVIEVALERIDIWFNDLVLDVGSSLGIPQGDVHTILIYHKEQTFSYRINEAVSLKSLPPKIGPDIDLVCPTSSFFTNIMIESSWLGTIWRPCSIRRGGAKQLFARLCAFRLFWHPAFTEVHH